MIQISKIDDKLTIYQQKEIIIFGASKGGSNILNLLQYFGIQIAAFCDNNSSKWGATFYGYPIISPSEMERQYNKRQVLVQIGSTFEKEIYQQVMNLGFLNIILYTEAYSRLSNLKYRNLYLNNPVFPLLRYKTDLAHKGTIQDAVYQHYMFSPSNNFVLLCMPPKTGDYTIMNTLSKHIDLCNLWHRPHTFDKNLLSIAPDKKTKIITAVREPISQNISMFLQHIDKADFYFFDIPEFWEHGGDAQKLFEIWLNMNHYANNTNPAYSKYAHNTIIQNTQYPFMIQDFFQRFNLHIHDLSQYSFNKEKGYSIYETEQYDIFVFQIEKLNHLKKYLLDWLELPDMELENGNIAAEKWCSGLYETIKNNLSLSEEYIEQCYNEPYVKHFYSESDIKKFKSKWQKQAIH